MIDKERKILELLYCIKEMADGAKWYGEKHDVAPLIYGMDKINKYVEQIEKEINGNKNDRQ